MATGKFQTTIASPDYREGLVVHLSREHRGVHALLFELYYEDKEIKMEIYQNAEG